jgi:hypothetical protein
MRKLRVAYMLPHHNITGGMKCLVEHIRLLRARGHRTIAVHRCVHASTPALLASYNQRHAGQQLAAATRDSSMAYLTAVDEPADGEALSSTASHDVIP